MDKESDYFRAGVGALIVDGRGDILVFRRSSGREDEWQLPQGGLHRGEPAIDAVFREVLEETSIARDRLELLAQTEEWVGYELPPEFQSEKTERGQVQKWFLLRFVGHDTDIRPDGSEFAEWRWIAATDLMSAAVPFRRALYEHLLERFALWS